MTQIWHKTELNRQAIIDQAHENTLVETLDIKITEIGDDFIKGTMPVDSRTKQPAGLLHGGASMALAETLASTGAYLCICLLYTSPSPRDATLSRMPSSA